VTNGRFGAGKHRISVADLALGDGVYWLQAKSGSNIFTKKIIKF
jgi:hypothetical protein